MNEIFTHTLENEEFVPIIDAPFVQDIVIPKLEDKLHEVFGRRFKQMEIQIDEMKTEGCVELGVDIYNNSSTPKLSRKFEFAPWEIYFDEKDFISHLDRTIHTFATNM